MGESGKPNKCENLSEFSIHGKRPGHQYGSGIAHPMNSASIRLIDSSTLKSSLKIRKRIHRDSTLSNFKVEVGTCRPPVAANRGNLLASFHPLALAHFDLMRIYVGINGSQSSTVIDYDYTTISPGRSRPSHDPIRDVYTYSISNQTRKNP